MSQFVQQYPIVLVLIGVGIGIVIWWLANPKPKKPTLSKVPAPEPTRNPVDLIIMGKRAIAEAVETRAAEIELDIRADHGARKDMQNTTDALISGNSPSANQLLAAISRHVQNCPASDPTPAAK